MGAPKQKWTSGEEAALRAGVVKYGPGKWRAIQKDPTLGPSLATRSNVDLKDKWRNMNVGSGVHVSGEKSIESLSKKTAKEPISVIPVACFFGEHSAEENRLDNIKSLGPRYDNLVLEAILGLKESSGSSISTIAKFIEEHERVPSNFRMLLNLKLRDLSLEGKVLKSRQKYVVIDNEHPTSKPEVTLEQKGDDVKMIPRVHGDARKKMRGVMKGNDSKISDKKVLQDSDGGKLTRMSLRNALRKPKDDHTLKKARMDVDFAKSKLKTAEEAARLAALAVAEAEAAAAVAEQTAKDAEADEAVAEVAEISAAIAALTSRPRKKSKSIEVRSYFHICFHVGGRKRNLKRSPMTRFPSTFAFSSH